MVGTVLVLDRLCDEEIGLLAAEFGPLGVEGREERADPAWNGHLCRPERYLFVHKLPAPEEGC